MRQLGRLLIRKTLAGSIIMQAMRRKTLALCFIIGAAAMILPGLFLGSWVGVFLVFIPLFAAIVIILRP